MSLSGKSYETIGNLLEEMNHGGKYLKNPDFAVEGFPRSANTFLVTALNISWPNMVVQSHSHDSKNITDADGSFPVVSVIRNPIDAIASCSVHLSLKNPEKGKNLTRIIDLYGDIAYCASNNLNVLTIPFDEVVSNIVGILDMLEDKYGLERRIPTSSESVLSKTADLSRLVNQTSESFTKKGHVPRDRHPLYAEILEELKDSVYAESLDNVTKLYEDLVSKYYDETNR